MRDILALAILGLGTIVSIVCIIKFMFNLSVLLGLVTSIGFTVAGLKSLREDE